MIKIIDVDELFDKYISDYVYKNIGKIKPEEIEDKMPVMYNEFGDTAISELDGKTPNEFYKTYSQEELLECLKEHLIKKVPVSDFLCEAILFKGDEKIAEELKKDNPEEFTLYLMNMLNDLNSSLAVDRYVDFVLYDYGESIRELATELLGDFADSCKERLLNEYLDANDTVKGCIEDILSKASRDDRIFGVLITAFKNNPKKVALYAGYLAKYGDENALPELYDAIEKENIDYADFEELRFAIEALGGEYNKHRSFKNDSSLKKIKGIKNTHIV